MTDSDEAKRAIELANRSIQYVGKRAGVDANELMDALLQPDSRTRPELFMDWLDFGGSDVGFGLGLIAAVSSAVGLMFALPLIAGLFLLAAFILCWWFA
jgi:hypothetical protein